MKIVRNNLIPPRGFKAVNLFGVLFAREEAVIDSRTLNHEQIHTEQMKEMLYIFFYLWYAIEWLVRLALLGDARAAYRAIGFEREARGGERFPLYPQEREHYAWLRCLKGGAL